MVRDYREQRRQRITAQKSKAQERRKRDERDRLQKPWKDLASPLAYGPIAESLGLSRHVTRDPGDQSASPHEQHFDLERHGGRSGIKPPGRNGWEPEW